MSFTLEKADSQEFARWWVVYRNTNEDFSQSFSEQYDELASVPFCNWIMQGDKRVGGIIMAGHDVGDFFLIPPFMNAYAALRDVLRSTDILNARNILSEHVHSLQMLGFQVEESRRWMLRPTQPYPNIPFEFERTVPQAEHAADLAALMYAAFHGGVGQYGKRDVEAHQKSVDNYFENTTPDSRYHQASSVLFDGEKMIAACLIQPYKSWVSIRFVVTHPDYQGRGLARQLIHYGIHTVHEVHDFVGLAVTIGNPAESLYHNMGFVSGAATYTLARA